MNERELMAIADPVIYADGFECALRLDEVRRAARVEVEPGTLEELLEARPGLGELLTHRNGLVCLRGREELVALRPPRAERARKLRRRAGRVARLLGGLPFVRGLALTGSVAAEDAEAGADIDLLVIVEPGRIGIAFLMLGGLARISGHRLFCPNYYLATDQLDLEPDGAYLAHELLQCVPLEGAATRLQPANSWVFELFPNARAGEVRARRESRARRALQRLLERPLAGRRGERLEGKAREIATARLTNHHRENGSATSEDVVEDLRSGRALRFHGSDARSKADAAHAERRADFARALGAEEGSGSVAA